MSTRQSSRIFSARSIAAKNRPPPTALLALALVSFVRPSLTLSPSSTGTSRDANASASASLRVKRVRNSEMMLFFVSTSCLHIGQVKLKDRQVDIHSAFSIQNKQKETYRSSRRLPARSNNVLLDSFVNASCVSAASQLARIAPTCVCSALSFCHDEI
jgi:hypothetical protein